MPIRFRWVTLWLVGLMVFTSGASAFAQATPVVDDGVYRDPAGRYSVPVPTNWHVEETDEYTLLVDPDDELGVYIVIVDAMTAQDAVAPVLEIAGASFDPATTEPVSSQTVPSAPEVDETLVVTYISSDQTSIAQVVAQRVGNTVYCLIFAGSLEAGTKRNSQLQVIASGFTIESLSQVDLTGVERAELTPELLDAYAAYGEDLLARLEMPGASIAIVVDGEIAWTQGFGVKNEAGDPVTADTQMMIGSITKSMTTMMMASEVDDELIAWDEPVIDILPEFQVADPDVTESITVRDMVCACTGVPRRDLEFIFNASELTAEDVIASLADFEFFTGFGEAFQYSNQMVAAGGYIAASAADGEAEDLAAGYEAEMQARVFDPIGMDDTTLSFNAVVTGADVATPYGVVLENEYVPLDLSVEEVLQPVAPAGLVWSTANDMGRYLITLLQNGVGPDGNRVVSEENLDETWQPQVAVSAMTDYGLGWFVEDYYGLRMIHHGGNTLGFTSELAFLPEEGIGVVILANSQAANVFTEGMRNRLFELLYGLPAVFDEQIDFLIEDGEASYDALMSQIADVPADVAAAAEGEYLSDVLGPVTLFVDDDELYLDVGEFQTRLKLAVGDVNGTDVTFVAADPPIPGTPFQLRNDGTELILEIETDEYVFTRIPSAGATPVAA